MLRDVIFAYSFGSGSTMDAFLIAFKIPNFFRRIFAEGAFTQAFLPILIEFQTKEDEQKLKLFLSHILGLLILSVSILTLFPMIAATPFTLIFAGGLARSPEQLALTASMLRITFPYLLLITVTSYYAALQYSHNRFALPAFTPVILNIVLIVCALYLKPHINPPIMALAWGVLIGGFIQLSIQLIAAVPIHSLVWPQFRLVLHPAVRRFLRLIVPAALSSSVVQINLLIDTLIASFLVSGSISWLYFADRLVQLPLSLFGLAITVVLLPQLSRLYQKKSDHSYRAMLSWGIHLGLILALPAAVGLILLAKPILITIYYHGAFTLTAIDKTTSAMQAYAIGLPAFILIKILSSAFFARQNTKTPLKIAALATLISIATSLTLVWFIAHIGLALATSIGSTLNAGILIFILFRNRLFIIGRAIGILLIRIVVALVLLIGFLIYLSPDPSQWTEAPALTRAVWLSLIVAAGVVLYFGSLWLTGLRWHHINPHLK